MQLEISWLGHAAFLLRGADMVLVDPFLTDNPAAKAGSGDVDCDIIAVTHGHWDHLGDAIPIARRTGAKLVAIAEIAEYAAARGVEEPVGMNMGGTVALGGTKLTMVPAWHSSGIKQAGFTHSGGVPAGFVIDTGAEGGRVYHPGDTCLFSDMKLIAMMYRPDVFLVPIGDRFTMDPVAGAMAVEMVRPRVAIPMHYDTWPPIEQDPARFASEVESRCGGDVEVRVMGVGETIVV